MGSNVRRAISFRYQTRLIRIHNVTSRRAGASVSGFYLDHPVCRQVRAWRRGQLVAGSGGQRRTCDLRAGVVADRI